ncbi:MAG: DNA polymerase III subunit delta' [Betaproteobacteria bacterium]|nr:DNA polymerase III subunit delta' [Betaproteobacteria bacterium]
MSLLPWHGEIWERLNGLKGRLPHAVLLKGRMGIGKLTLAQYWAKALLCEKPGQWDEPCGRCVACGWFQQGNHPDFRLVEPDSSGEEGTESGESRVKRSRQHIGVEQIRDLSDFLNVSSHRGGFRIALIHPADAMNAPAANALLKTLEEPGAGTVFILVSHHPQRLPATVLSRCHQISATRPDPGAAQGWLKEQGAAEPELCLAEAGGAPLAALEFSDVEYRQVRKNFLDALAKPKTLDPIVLADRLQKVEPARIVLWLQKWCYDLASLRLAGRVRYNPDFAERIAAVAPGTDLPGLTRYLRTLVAAQRVAQHPLNSRLFAEDLLLSYRELAQSRRGNS